MSDRLSAPSMIQQTPRLAADGHLFLIRHDLEVTSISETGTTIDNRPSTIWRDHSTIVAAQRARGDFQSRQMTTVATPFSRA